MRARVTLSGTHAWLERLLALVGAAAVITVLALGFDVRFANKFTMFAATLACAPWLPVLARRGWSMVGQVTLTSRVIEVQGRFWRRRIPLTNISGARAVAGRRGASVLLSLGPHAVVGLALDRKGDAESLAARIRKATGTLELVQVPCARSPRWVGGCRITVTALAIAYYLHVVHHAIPGNKAMYAIPALLVGAALVLLHCLRHRPVPDVTVFDFDALSTHPAAIRAHLATHFHQATLDESESTQPPHLANTDEGLAGWLNKQQALLASDEHYRGGPGRLRVDLEEAVISAALPVAERALALRLVANNHKPEVLRRIAGMADNLAEEAAWLEQVALAASDEAALRMVERRVPRFVPVDGE